MKLHINYNKVFKDGEVDFGRDSSAPPCIPKPTFVNLFFFSQGTLLRFKKKKFRVTPIPNSLLI